MNRKLAPAVLVALLFACNRTKEPPPSQSTLTPTPPSASVEPPEPHVDLDSIPTEHQYEEEAWKEITPKNLLQKVDELEKEIKGK
jgi:hypothetical protein